MNSQSDIAAPMPTTERSRITVPTPQNPAGADSDSNSRPPRLWIDLDNSPHVPLFAPLIRYLREQGWPVKVTARDFAQTLDLVEQLGVDAQAVGRHAGRSKVRKVLNLPVRTGQLLQEVMSFRPDIALSHGSRTQTLAAALLRIPSVVMFDYEWTEMRIFSRFARHLVCPASIPENLLREAGIPPEKVVRYEGFKEELYLPEFRPDPGFRAELGAADGDLLITIRPPGLIGNYHDEQSEAICARLLERAVEEDGRLVVVLPKTRVEAGFIRSVLPDSHAGRLLIPERALPGLQLLYHSDMAFSGGGTMNRESALLGTPTFSLFTGRRPAVDMELERMGRLRFLERPGDVDQVVWKKRDDAAGRNQAQQHRLLYEVVAMMLKFASC